MLVVCKNVTFPPEPHPSQYTSIYRFFTLGIQRSSINPEYQKSKTNLALSSLLFISKFAKYIARMFFLNIYEEGEKKEISLI